MKPFLFNRFADTFGTHYRSFNVCLRHDNEKFLSAEATVKICPAEVFADNGGRFPENDISGKVAQCIIDILKMIDIQHDDGEGCAPPGHSLPLILQQFHDVAPVIGSGEFVTDGKLQIHAHSFVKFFAQNAYVAANNGKGNQHQGKKQHMEKLHLEIDVLKTKTIKKEKIKSIACNHKQTDKQKTAEDQPEYAEHKDDNINKQQHRP